MTKVATNGLAQARSLAPGLFLSAAVALASVLAAPLIKSATGGRIVLPDMVIALIFGIALHRLAMLARFQAGIACAVKTLLRYAIALLGLRIAFGDIAALGLGSAVLV
ncbi:MAG: putative sulfate exporter family transporter, partial [Methylobacterium sp.]|nr:putative sulfate exporter family transporter [Methylobacterium sp.]